MHLRRKEYDQLVFTEIRSKSLINSSLFCGNNIKNVVLYTVDVYI